ncbi:unnamed protein product [Trifolium pratense]|uniref:Uncharacterized protein n=1 Tax=Trifolium pratense TaxID=57577 RepID=A0ACB0JC00_TRIPR|nr:unnamed protein product [Trifolium pratense]
MPWEGDDVVHCKYGEKSAQSLSSAGFRYVAFKSYEGIGHYTVPREMGEVSTWLSSSVGMTLGDSPRSTERIFGLSHAIIYSIGGISKIVMRFSETNIHRSVPRIEAIGLHN